MSGGGHDPGSALSVGVVVHTTISGTEGILTPDLSLIREALNHRHFNELPQLPGSTVHRYEID